MKLADHLEPKSIRGENGNGSGPDGRPAGKKRLPRILYIFDEPTTGLHFDDVSKLLSAFRKLIESGGSIVVIEHNLDVIRAADWVIDLRPEGGGRGGKVIVTGTPDTVTKTAGSLTGH